MNTIKAMLLGVVIGLMISAPQLSIAVEDANTQESAINQAASIAKTELEVSAAAYDLGIACGFFISVSVEQCAQFTARVNSDPALKNAILQAKQKNVYVWPGTEFKIDSSIITVKRDASAAEITKFLLGKQKQKR